MASFLYFDGNRLVMEGGIPERFSRCEVCRAGLGNIKLDTPLYCIACIEDMENLSMSPKKYKRYRELRGTLSKS